MRIARLYGLAFLILNSACTQRTPSQPQSPTAYKVVLIAGDNSLRVFDNAVAALRARLLLRHGIAAPDITRLSAAAAASNRTIQRATFANVVDAIAAMHPAQNQACLVFATSHGVQDGGLYLSPNRAALSPAALDQALTLGCGNAPTFVIVSACFSGQFAEPPMTQPNRIILTAARPDRTSFGCQAGRTYTVYDQCLLTAFDTAPDWHQLYALTKNCVGIEEDRQQVQPSEPQAWFGSAVADMPIPAQE
jgi:hypothetical protein